MSSTEVNEKIKQTDEPLLFSDDNNNVEPMLCAQCQMRFHEIFYPCCLDKFGPIHHKFQTDKLESNLSKLRERIEELKRHVENRAEKVKHYCDYLRQEIDISTESIIVEINKLNMQLKEKVNDYESKCVASIGQNDSLKTSVEAKLNEIAQFYDRSTAMCLSDSNDAKFYKLEQDCLKHMYNMKLANMLLKEASFSKKQMRFEANEDLNESILGKFNYESFWLPPFKKLRKIEANKLFENLTQIYEATYLSDGNLAIAYEDKEEMLHFAKVNGTTFTSMGGFSLNEKCSELKIAPFKRSLVAYVFYEETDDQQLCIFGPFGQLIIRMNQNNRQRDGTSDTGSATTISSSNSNGVEAGSGSSSGVGDSNDSDDDYFDEEDFSLLFIVNDDLSGISVQIDSKDRIYSITTNESSIFCLTLLRSIKVYNHNLKLLRTIKKQPTPERPFKLTDKVQLVYFINEKIYLIEKKAMKIIRQDENNQADVSVIQIPELASIKYNGYSFALKSSDFVYFYDLNGKKQLSYKLPSYPTSLKFTFKDPESVLFYCMNYFYTK
jgi:hypothetical protein